MKSTVTLVMLLGLMMSTGCHHMAKEESSVSTAAVFDEAAIQPVAYTPSLDGSMATLDMAEFGRRR